MKHTIDGFITYEKSRYSKKPTISFQSYRPSDDSYFNTVVVRPHSIEVEVPDDFDPRSQQIDALKAQQQKATAAYHAMVTDIKRQISELEAIEYVAAV